MYRKVEKKKKICKQVFFLEENFFLMKRMFSNQFLLEFYTNNTLWSMTTINSLISAKNSVSCDRK